MCAFNSVIQWVGRKHPAPEEAGCFFFLQREEGENQSAQGTASDGRLLRRRIQADCNGCLIAVESFVDARTLQGTSAGQSERRTACNERPATSRRSAHIDALWRRLEETAGGEGGGGASCSISAHNDVAKRVQHGR